MVVCVFIFTLIFSFPHVFVSCNYSYSILKFFFFRCIALADWIKWFIGQRLLDLRRTIKGRSICTCQVNMYFQVIFHESDYCITIYVSGVPSEIYQTVNILWEFGTESFHCKSCHSLHGPSLPPSSPSNINPLHFYLATNFHSHRNSLCDSLSLSCNFSEREREKKNNLFGSLPLSRLLFVSSSQFHFSPPGSLSLSLLHSLRAFARGSEREFSLISHTLAHFR